MVKKITLDSLQNGKKDPKLVIQIWNLSIFATYDKAKKVLRDLIIEGYINTSQKKINNN